MPNYDDIDPPLPSNGKKRNKTSVFIKTSPEPGEMLQMGYKSIIRTDQ